MFAPSMAIPRFGHGRAWRLATRVATVVAQFGLLVAFGVAGTVFFGLTIASPVAVPAAARQGIELSAADLATAQQLASVWWLFALGAVLSFAAALATIGSLIQHLASSPGE
ncbi:MAG TPA: hypothetical protein VK697_05355 [Methylomirabilota bacterium]|nr:hypothetical protein [Methylomirabilota bacterium]